MIRKEMRKRFASRVRFIDLPKQGVFKMTNTDEDPPEPLGKGRYRVRCITKDGGFPFELSTFEGSIGNIMDAMDEGKDNWIIALGIRDGDNIYVNFEPWLGD